jgi:hypothetical protein
MSDMLQLVVDRLEQMKRIDSGIQSDFNRCHL